MKLCSVLTALLLGVCAVLPAGEKLIAKWDFSKGSFHSLCGKYGMEPQKNKASILSGPHGKYLYAGKPGAAFKNVPGGIRSKEVYKDLYARAFRVKITFSLRKEALGKSAYIWLWDQKYVPWPHKDPQYNCGFMFYLYGYGKDKVRPDITLGYGTKSCTVRGKPFQVIPGRKYTLSVSHDGVEKVTFRLDDNKPYSSIAPEKGWIAPPVRPLVIGDRSGSSFSAFPGEIYSAEFTELPFTEIKINAEGRMAFGRWEKSPQFRIRLQPSLRKDLANVKLTFQGKDNILSGSKTLSLSGKGTILALPVRSNLTAGVYPCTFTAVTSSGNVSTETLLLKIAPQRHDDQIRFFWLYGQHYYKEMLDMGFTHLSDHHSNYLFDLKKLFREDLAKKRIPEMDKMLCDGVNYMEMCSVSVGLTRNFPRYTKDGKKVFKNADALDPQLRSIVKKVTEWDASAVENHPAFAGVMTSSEVRDHAFPSYTEDARKSWEKYSGVKVIPQAGSGRVAPHYSRLTDFPADRVIPEDYELLRYYRWYWKHGDGWNDLQTLVRNAYESKIKHPIISYYDPVNRVPPLWGSGGNVSHINEWTYVYPEPYNIDYVVSKQKAMAEGNPGQKVMTMIQGIAYRSVTAPVGQSVKKLPKWLPRHNAARYITTPPDLMKIALWTIAARQLDGIGLYAWRSIFDSEPFGWSVEKSTYQYTNAQTAGEIGKFFKEVARPLGMILKSVPERPSEVALLDSYSAVLFAQRGTFFGNSNFLSVGSLALSNASFNPAALYEEQIAKKGFGNTKVLFMLCCDVLTKTTFEKVRQFQKQGGIVVADRYLLPGIIPDLVLEEVFRTQDIKIFKKDLDALAARIKKLLAPYVKPYVSSSNKDYRFHTRSHKGNDIVFVINDKRTFGDYVGQFGLVMEKGLPNAGDVVIRRKNTGAVYDLVHHKKVPFRSRNGETVLQVKTPAAEGHIFLLTEKPLKDLRLSLPASVKQGSAFTIKAELPSYSSYLPIEVLVLDPAGKRSDESCFATLKDGKYVQNALIPGNAPKGKWSVRIRNLADGKVIHKNLIVQ